MPTSAEAVSKSRSLHTCALGAENMASLVSDPGGVREVTRWLIKASLADAIGELLQPLVANGFTRSVICHNRLNHRMRSSV